MKGQTQLIFFEAEGFLMMLIQQRPLLDHEDEVVAKKKKAPTK